MQTLYRNGQRFEVVTMNGVTRVMAQVRPVHHETYEGELVWIVADVAKNPEQPGSAKWIARRGHDYSDPVMTRREAIENAVELIIYRAV